MKTRLLIMAMLLMPVLFGCNKNQDDNLNAEELIVGEWYAEYVESSYYFSDNPSENYSETEYFDAQESATFTFSEDRTVLIRYTDSSTMQSTWAIEGNYLVITSEDIPKERYEFSFVDKDHFYYI